MPAIIGKFRSHLRPPRQGRSPWFRSQLRNGMSQISRFSRIKGLSNLKRRRLTLDCAGLVLITLVITCLLLVSRPMVDECRHYRTLPHCIQRSTLFDNFTQNDVCIIPKLDPYGPEIKRFDRSIPPVKCSREKNWVYVKNGTFRIREDLKIAHGKVMCEYTALKRGQDDFTVMHDFRINNMLDGSPLVSDFFEVSCIDASNRWYEDVLMGVAFKPLLHERGEKRPLSPLTMGGYDVFIFGFDSMSRMSWIRNLPKTREFFTKELGGIELEGHNILGDGTVQNLLPLLTGQTEHDLPSARVDNPRAVTLDDFPWIWNDFQTAGYVTAYGEDMQTFGTFQMRLKGFSGQPVDHFMRPYFLAAEPRYPAHREGCVGSEPRHIRFFNYYRDMYQMYGAKRKFMFGFHSEQSHRDNNHMKAVDEDFVNFLRGLRTANYLNRTIFILLSDHGSRYTDIRQTQQGKLEERLPYIGFWFPQSFKSAYAKEVEQVGQNRKRLTTNFDLHETLSDLLDNSPTRPSRTKGRGISLFKPVPESRTCEQAGIEPHWCACLNWGDMSHDQKLKGLTGQAVVDFINSLTAVARDKCEELSLHSVDNLISFIPRKDVLMFKKSVDRHGDIPDLSENLSLTFQYLQVTFVTEAGQGRFEATVKHAPGTGAFTVLAEDISRTNAYGNASACVFDTFPNLRKYCYCKH